MRKYPIQPLYLDPHGLERFKSNAVVEYFLYNGVVDLNDLALVDFVSHEEHEHFAQLIGYSLRGFGELSYVSDKTFYAATLEKYIDSDSDKPIENKLVSYVYKKNKHLIKKSIFDMSFPYDDLIQFNQLLNSKLKIF